MSSQEIFEWVKISLPLVVLLVVLSALLILRKLLARLSLADIKKERELGRIIQEGKQVVETITQLSILMAESRLLELEVTKTMFSSIFTPEQQQKMEKHIEELHKLANVKEQARRRMAIAPEPYLSAYLNVMCATISLARYLAWGKGNNEQIADLMDAIHVIPELLNEWERCDEPALRATFLAAYDKKWAQEPNSFSMMDTFNQVYSRVQADKPTHPTQDELLTRQ